MHKIYTYVKRQKKEWKILTISMVTDKYKGFPLEAEQTNKKLVMCFASICLKYCIYMKISTLLWLHVKLKVIFLVLFFFSLTIRWNDLDKFTSARKYVFSAEREHLCLADQSGYFLNQ